MKIKLRKMVKTCKTICSIKMIYNNTGKSKLYNNVQENYNEIKMYSGKLHHFQQKNAFLSCNDQRIRNFL